MAETTSGKVSARTAPPKPPTKKGELTRLLQAKAGADVTTLAERLGWQPHKVRAAITGLRKGGHIVVATEPAGGGGSRYQIVSGAEQAKAEKPRPTTVEQEEAAQAPELAEARDAR